MNQINEFTKKNISDTLGDIEYDYGNNLKKNATGQQRTQGFSFDADLRPEGGNIDTGLGSLTSTGGRGVGDIL